MTLTRIGPSVGMTDNPPQPGTIQTTSFIVSKECFNDGGRISIGKPIGPMDATVGVACTGSFSGNVDNFKVFIDGKSTPSVSYDFDKVIDGSVLVDSSGNGHDLKIIDPYNKGNSSLTPSVLPAPEIKPEVSISYENETSKQIIVEYCTSLFTNIKIQSECSGLGDSTRQVFSDKCTEKYLRDGKDSAVYTLASYLDLCYKQLKNKTAEEGTTRLLCFLRPDLAGYVGENCDIPCVNPDISDPTTCSCRVGYFGPKCDQVCPGGADNPCSNNGKCHNVTGLCSCTINRAGADCSQCASGYSGADCSVTTITPPTTSIVSGSFSGNSYLKTPDGAEIQVNNYDQPVVLYNHSSMLIEVQKGPTENYESGVKAIAYSAGGTNVTIYPHDSGTVKVNGEIVPLGTVTLPGGYQLNKTSLEVITCTGPNNFKSTIFLNDDSMSTQLSVSKTSCNQATGLLGCQTFSPSVCASTDIACIIRAVGLSKASTTYNITEEDIKKYLQHYSKPFENTVFKSVGDVEVTAGYALEVSNRGSVQLPPFDAEMLNSNSTTYSFETRAKFETKTDCTVLSVSNQNTTLGIIMKNGYYYVKYGEFEYPTNCPVTNNTWTNVGLSIDQKTGICLFHEIHDGGNSIYKQINMTQSILIYGPPVQEGGKTVLGKWQNVLTGLPYICFRRVYLTSDCV
ncbi:hypothetical protein DPMN_003897 [Dreissena polymorpha]|uniref:Uncharacterized protein n=1 Tax=Dreissena polymorpha TaxID=45954 RepID=A0A9D4MPR9_DREPO|nr:hypothetical protein DPMN_003897 [Dreissena polymorpha]